MRIFRWYSVVVVVAVITLIGQVGPASADWPMARHDPKRTASASGASDIKIPVAFWRYYLGGAVLSENLRFVDTDGAGAAEVVVVTGGRALAKRTSDETVWQTPPLDLTKLVAVIDLDGDASPEVVVRSRDHVYVLAASDGRILWAEPDGEMGTIGGVRVGDLDGDGYPEIVIAECGCCTVRTQNPGFVYSFVPSVSTPRLLWQLPVSSCGAAARSLTLVDMVPGDGVELVIGTMESLEIIDGASGVVVASTGNIGTRIMRSQCVPAEIDGTAGDELVCVLNSAFAPATNQRRVFAVDYQSGSDPVLRLMWSKTLAPDVGGELNFNQLVSDLDRDGLLEVLIASMDATRLWTTRILSAADGTEVATLPGQILQGSFSVATGRDLLTAGGRVLTAWRFDRTATPALRALWTLQDVAVSNVADPELQRATTLDRRVVTANVGGDGAEELLVQSLVGPSRLMAVDSASGMLAADAQFELPPGSDIIQVWPVAQTIGNGRVALLQSDGTVRLLTEGLEPLAPSDDILPQPLRFGGYVVAGGWRDLRKSLVVGALEATAVQSPLVVDSRGSLVRLDTRLASLASPPTQMWARARSSGAAIVPSFVNGGPGIACFRREEEASGKEFYFVDALNASGTQVWTTPIPEAPLNDLVAGRFSSDAVRDLAFQWGSPGDALMRVRALSGDDGSILWESEPVDDTAGRQPAGFSVGQFNNDTFQDVFLQAVGTHVVSGADGTTLGSSVIGPRYFQPMLANLDLDPEDEIVLQGGFDPVRILDHDLSTELWLSDDNDKPAPYGALARCADGSVRLVEGSWQNPARLKISDFADATSASITTLVLANGAAYSDEVSAGATGAFLGQLSSAAVHANLVGNGQPSAVVGSTDGWLYAIDPCNATLQFSFSVGAAVGSPIFGDTDGDGIDEVLVSAADGYLYDIRNLAIASPGRVIDIDPERPNSSSDIDEITTNDQLAATWSGVPGADSYEVAVVDDAGRHMANPEWTDVGEVTSTALSGLPLLDGAVYFFVVRARSGLGRSVDARSDGIIVRLPSRGDAGFQDAGPDGGMSPPRANGGCCNSRTSSKGGWPIVCCVLIWMLCIRREDSATE